MLKRFCINSISAWVSTVAQNCFDTSARYSACQHAQNIATEYAPHRVSVVYHEQFVYYPDPDNKLLGEQMEPIEFLHRVEAMSVSLFESYHCARIAAGNEQKVFLPQQQYYAYIFEHRSHIEEYNDETLNHYYGKLAEAHKALLLANVAAGAVAGAILQVARQCISLAWSATAERMNKGRLVGSQHLSSVIWHARNQALHFEEGIPKNENTWKSIKLLSDEFGIPIDNLDNNPRALSVEIFDVLGWSNYESYAKDMVEMVNAP